MENIAQYGLILLLSAFLVFHLLVILKKVPYTLVWGERLKSDKEMYHFEIVSTLINLFFLFVVLVHSNTLEFELSKKLTNVFLWLMTVLFALNTVGNSMSKNKLEQILFTPITILMTIFSLILALSS